MRLILAFVLLALGCGARVENSVPGPAPEEPAPVFPKAPPRQRGSVLMLTELGEASGFSAVASFGPARTNAGTPCEADYGAPSSQKEKVEASAGTIAMHVQTPGKVERLELPYTDEGYRFAYLTSTRMRFDVPGGTIKVVAPGDAVPAFDGVVPAATGATLEDVPEQITGDGKDLILRWNDSGDDDVLVSLRIGKDTRITCTFPASTKRGVIPGELVKKSVETYLASGAPCTTSCGHFLFASLRSTTLAAGTFDVRLAHGVVTMKPLAIAP